MADAVAVIGAGVLGVACARALQRAGRRVVLFDPEPPGALCSSGNAGHIALDHVRPLARPDVLAAAPRMLTDPLGPLILRWRGLPALSPWLARFALAARPMRVSAGTAALTALLATALQDWQAELLASGLSAMLRQEGALNVMETPAGAAAAAAEGRILAAHGMTFQDLTAAEVMQHLPALAITPASGRLYPQAAHVVDPFRLVQALADRFAADGGEIVPAPVTGFQRDGAQIAALATPHGEHPVDAVVLTAGLASAALGRQLGVSLPLTAERGYHAMLAIGALPVPLPTTFNERGFVLTPMEHGIRLAGTVELGAAGRAPDWARADILAAHVRQLFATQIETTSRWQGDRPTLPDYLPALGRAPGIANLVVAAGHQHLGLTLAAVSARIVAALVADEPPGIDLHPFDPGRFMRRVAHSA
ncbi:MAG: FAD-dependent oxidoreductase [Acetobacteraceae bacterium]|nr:FAD-dependent oxidoreductase [Acetobacteraceae bacterium]